MTTGADDAGPVDDGDPAATDDPVAEVTAPAGDDGGTEAADVAEVTGAVPVGAAWWLLEHPATAKEST